VVQIAFLRRFLGLEGSDETVEAPLEVAPLPPAPRPEPTALVACPYCGSLLDPPPDHTRLCPNCRHRIVVRHSEGRAIYLTETAVDIYEAERQAELEKQAWTRERRKWLQLARLVGAPADQRRDVANTPVSSAAVDSARTVYLVAAERAVQAARRDKRWDDVSRIRRRQAAALFEEAGSAPPVTDEIVTLYREGVAATLRGLRAVSREAELVGAPCCHACRGDNERIFRIADELRTPRLPHPGCPRGLCPCDWWPALPNPTKKRSRRRPASASPPEAPGIAHTSPDPETSVADLASDTA
jgi:DNA-directed RNA polymerase subunit RPC12/RpoP